MRNHHFAIVALKNYGLIPFAWHAAIFILRSIGMCLTTAMYQTATKGTKHNLRIQHGTRIAYAKRVVLGNNVSIAEHVHFASETSSGFAEICDDVEIDANVKIDFSGSLRIERGVLVSPDAIISTHSHGYDPKSTPQTSRLVIGSYAWIGMRAIILSQCNYIGSRSIIAAGAVVTKDIPDNSIYLSTQRVYPRPS
jgi:acetyltransferase-like isoleucine patch superfamily enzyme